MNKRAVISVGCNSYSSIKLKALSGAENDAEQIFVRLTESDNSDYNPALSKLLLSPTLDQFRSAINDVLFTEVGLDVLTIFFAGHGGPKNGSYYFCLSDTDPARMSTTAYPLNALFTVLNECQPAQTNIIIDSCQAGGLVGDLSVLLKPESTGSNNSPSISLLAAACSNEFASEVNGNGVVTKLILDYLDGIKKINTSNSHLGLNEIGMEISESIKAEYKQTPTVWGLSICGHSKFAKNPHFNLTENSATTKSFLDISPNSVIGKKLSAFTEDLWGEYRATEVEPNAERLASLLRKVIDDISIDQDGVAAFINGISNSFEQQAVKSNDSCGAITINSTMLVLLAKFLIPGGAVEGQIISLLTRRKELINQLVDSVIQGLEADEFYLLNKNLSSADLFYLPIRISKLLGVIFSQVLIDEYASERDMGFIHKVKKVAELILKYYKGSIVSVSDEQAPYIYIVAKASGFFDADEEVKNLLFLYINDLLVHRGNVASASINADEILKFLLNRNAGTDRSSPDLLANPSQLISVFLCVAPHLVDVTSLDTNMKALDHQSLVVFIPDSYTLFSENIIYDGINNSFKIGHGIWTVQDFQNEFYNECLPLIVKNKPATPLNEIISVIASLIFPNRIPWYLEIK